MASFKGFRQSVGTKKVALGFSRCYCYGCGERLLATIERLSRAMTGRPRAFITIHNLGIIAQLNSRVQLRIEDEPRMSAQSENNTPPSQRLPCRSQSQLAFPNT